MRRGARGIAGRESDLCSGISPRPIRVRPMTPTHQRPKHADEFIERCRGDVSRWLGIVHQMALDDELFWQANAVAAAHPALRDRGNDLLAMLGSGYGHRTLVQLRAATDRSEGSVSVAGVLDALARNPACIPREWFVQLWLHEATAANRSRLEAMAHDAFTRTFEAGTADVIPAGVFERRREKLIAELEKCTRYVRKRLAHFDRSASPDSPTFTEIRLGVRRVALEVRYLGLLLNGHSPGRIGPVRAYNWYDVLKFAWLAEDGHPPRVVTLDELRLPEEDPPEEASD